MNHALALAEFTAVLLHVVCLHTTEWAQACGRAVQHNLATGKGGALARDQPHTRWCCLRHRLACANQTQLLAAPGAKWRSGPTVRAGTSSPPHTSCMMHASGLRAAQLTPRRAGVGRDMHEYMQHTYEQLRRKFWRTARECMLPAQAKVRAPSVHAWSQSMAHPHLCSHQSPLSSQACTASGWRQGSPAACMRMATRWLTAPAKAASLTKRPASRSWRRSRRSSLDVACRLRSCMLMYSTRLSRAAHTCVAENVYACACRAERGHA